MSKTKIGLSGYDLTVESFIQAVNTNALITIPDTVITRISDNWDAIATMLDRGDVMYGLNTGIGGQGNVKISKEKAGELSTRMLRAHASGWGNWVDEATARATLMLRLNVFAKGYSGVRKELFRAFVDMLNRGVTPAFYEKGSVGTSGDLAPLSQMGLVVIGEGNAYFAGKIMPANQALKNAGLKPLELAYREGLAIMNGSQFMTAIAADNIFAASRLMKQLEIISAMTIEVLNCVESAYSKKYNGVRPFIGQNITAANIRSLIEGSELMRKPKTNVQNAYSLRSVPQVAGAARDALEYIREITEIEMNAVADNPIFFTDELVCRTGANFHGAPIGYTQDLLGIILTDLGNLSERQTNNLLDPACSKSLPGFLVKTPGLDSGLMISQYTQAALVSENKILASPASVDSIPVSGNQEDHVSFGTIAARKAREILRNTETVLAIQLLAVCQAYEFIKPTKPSKTFNAVYTMVRRVSPVIDEDRAFYTDIDLLVPLIRSYKILDAAEAQIGKLE